MRARRAGRRLARLFIASGLALLGATPAPVAAQAEPPVSAPQRQPDPFYSGLMRDGRTALLRGDAASAARDLRIACFGFLDFPATLAECRIRLGLAQAALGDRDAFIESFSRLEDLEDRFQVYAAAAVTAEERARFEEKAFEWISPEVLRTIPAFAPILERKKEADFARLTPRERTKELERRAAAEPENPRWSLELAEEELAREKPAAAVERLAKLPDAAGDGAAGCLRGRALGELERCNEAVKSLAACAKSSVDPRLADLLLACYLDLDQAAEARAFAATLAPAIAARPELRKRIAKIPERDKAGKPKPTAAAPPATTAAKPAAIDKPPAGSPASSVPPKPAAAAPRPASKASATAARPSSSDQSAIAEVRKTARTAEKRDELERALSRAQPIADRYPKEPEYQLLVGELGYRTGKWKTGADYLLRPDGRGPSDPTLRFYLAVCQFESGDTAAAARTAATGLEKLPRTPLVEGYLKRILPAK